MYILAEAIERAGSLDPDAIVAELEKTDRDGVMGRIRFDEGHQVGLRHGPGGVGRCGRVPVDHDGGRTIVFPPSPRADPSAGGLDRAK